MRVHTTYINIQIAVNMCAKEAAQYYLHLYYQGRFIFISFHLPFLPLKFDKYLIKTDKRDYNVIISLSF
jgi:hypothetical protein